MTEAEFDAKYGTVAVRLMQWLAIVWTVNQAAMLQTEASLGTAFWYGSLLAAGLWALEYVRVRAVRDRLGSEADKS